MLIFFENRLSRTTVTGLPLTTFLLAAGYFGLIFYSNALDFGRLGRLVQIDIAVSEGMSNFRTPLIVRFFSVLTAFGSWGIILVLAIAASVLLLLNDRSRYLVSMWVVLAGNQISVNLLKAIFARGRPVLAYYSEASYSFPSGHSAASTAFFGFVTYILIKERILPARLSVFGGVLVILLVGMSRLVLGEHYLSDVMNGVLLGTLWALMGIWLVKRGYWMSEKPQELPSAKWRSWVNFSVVATAAITLWILVALYQHNLTVLPVSTAAH